MTKNAFDGISVGKQTNYEFLFSIFTIAKQSPPIPVDPGSVTDNTAEAAIAASTALPPSSKIKDPTSTASGWGAVTIPCVNISSL